jgi:hypothetical protein
LEKLVKAAAGVVSGSSNLIGVRKAMELVGFLSRAYKYENLPTSQMPFKEAASCGGWKGNSTPSYSSVSGNRLVTNANPATTPILITSLPH